MKKKKKEMKIGTHPAAIELAKLLRHPKSGHSMPHGKTEYYDEIESVIEELKRIYPDDPEKHISSQIIRCYVNGTRKPTLKTTQLFVDAYNSIYTTKINPEKWFESLILKMDNFSETQRAICRNISQITDKTILSTILELTRANLKAKFRDKKINSNLN